MKTNFFKGNSLENLWRGYWRKMLYTHKIHRKNKKTRKGRIFTCHQQLYHFISMRIMKLLGTPDCIFLPTQILNILQKSQHFCRQTINAYRKGRGVPNEPILVFVVVRVDVGARRELLYYDDVYHEFLIKFITHYFTTTLRDHRNLTALVCCVPSVYS